MLQVALAVAEEGVDLNPFKPAFGLVVWTLIALVVLLYLLAKKVFPRLEETLADREQRIKTDLETAEKTRSEAERILDDYKQKVAQAREETNRIIEESRASADAVRKDLVTKAESEARLIVDKAQAQISDEKDRAVEELKGQLAQWSADIASKIVGRELTSETHSELVDAFIKDVQEKETK